MRRNSIAVAFLLLVAIRGAFAQGADAPKAKVAPKHLAVAQQLVAHLDLSNTNYQHGTPSVSFTAPYESHADCSGFVDALLEYSYGIDKDVFRTTFGSGRPTAARYHDAIIDQKSFQRIEHVQNLLPGDFLAVKYFARKDDTGHVMLVAGRPLRLPEVKEPVIEGTMQWEVPVIDSSKSGHGTTDTRHKKGADGKDHDGVGEGILRVYSDAAGDVAGFSWSSQSVSKFEPPNEEELVMGRFEVSAK
ncbi:MAG TPA: hypothetical protein VGI75_08015 [Pirellulales bacterium]